jgi:hypothetical protein
MSKTERFQWIVIYLNVPLWIAVGTLFFFFDQRILCTWIVLGDIIVLGIGLYFGGRTLFRVESSENEKNG